MGKYDHIFNTDIQSDETLSSEEGVAAIAFIAMIADGEVPEEDYQALRDLIANLDIFDDYSTDEIQELFDKIIKIGQQEGAGSLFNAAVESLSEDIVETAFASAVEMVLTDSTVSVAEDSFLYDLSQSLGLSEEAAQEIIDEFAYEEA